MAVWVPPSLGGASGPVNGCQREEATRRRQGGARVVCAPVAPPEGGRAGEPAHPHPDRRHHLLPCPYLRPAIPISPVCRRRCAAPCGTMNGVGEPVAAALATCEPLAGASSPPPGVGGVTQTYPVVGAQEDTSQARLFLAQNAAHRDLGRRAASPLARDKGSARVGSGRAPQRSTSWRAGSQSHWRRPVYFLPTRCVPFGWRGRRAHSEVRGRRPARCRRPHLSCLFWLSECQSAAVQAPPHRLTRLADAGNGRTE